MQQVALLDPIKRIGKINHLALLTNSFLPVNTTFQAQSVHTVLLAAFQESTERYRERMRFIFADTTFDYLIAHRGPRP